MITERTLKKWRLEALKNIKKFDQPVSSSHIDLVLALENKILRMTQELLDQHLLRRSE